MKIYVENLKPRFFYLIQELPVCTSKLGMQQLVRFATTQQRARASCYVMKYDKKSTSVTNPDQFGANFLLNSEKKVTKHVKGRKIPDRTRKKVGSLLRGFFYNTCRIYKTQCCRSELKLT